MESRNTHNTDEAVNENLPQSSHWLPALRPNDVDDKDHPASIIDTLETSRIADPTSIEPSTVPESQKDAPNNIFGLDDSQESVEETVVGAPDRSHLSLSPMPRISKGLLIKLAVEGKRMKCLKKKMMND